MPDTGSPLARLVASELEAAGHTIHRCHDDATGPPTCRAVLGEDCPLDTVPIDVAVTVRPIASAAPLPTEDGILCAIRRRIPVVVTGAVRDHPFRAAATVEAADAANAVVAVARGVLPGHTAVATDVLHTALPQGAAARALVRRRKGGALHVTIETGPGLARAAAIPVAVRVARALREYDPWAPSLDLSIEAVS